MNAPDASGADTFAKLLAANARTRGARSASREKEYGIWQSWTWAEVEEETRALAMGLLALGLAPGAKVAIVGSNRPRLYWSMVAIQMAGGVPVPVYQDAVAEEMQFILEHCGAVFAIVENQEQVDKVLSINDRLPELGQIIYGDPRGLRNYDHATLHPYTEVQAEGRRRKAELAPRIDATIAAGTGSDTCVMLYTSGTTGRPKGVVLSNDNIILTARASAEFDGLVETDETLAYLPMAWVGDFIFSMGQAYVKGFCVSCPESAETMMHDLKEIGPTYFFAPPRIFETMLTNVMIRIEDAGPMKRAMFHRHIDLARTAGEALARDHQGAGWFHRQIRGTGTALGGILWNGLRSLALAPFGGVKRWRDPLNVAITRAIAGEAAATRLAYAAGDKLVYGPLKNVLGMSRVRVGYTAGEAIGPEIFTFFRTLGINLKQLYGQTEASVFITQQPDDAVSADTVGVATPGVEIRIDEATGEVFYRSPGVFQEYFKNAEATAETKDAEGWVATGDAGFFDAATGQLRILDRAKDVGKLSSGALFAPKYVENKLKFYPNILEAVCFGDGREMVTAMLNIDLTAVGNWAERNNIAYSSYQELAGHPRVYAMLQEHVEEMNRSLAEDPMLSACQIQRFVILHKELDADDGELTRTRKVRRRHISEKFEPIIAALYDGSPQVFAEVEVTYEDGRKGSLKGTLEIRDCAVVATEQKVAAE